MYDVNLVQINKINFNWCKLQNKFFNDVNQNNQNKLLTDVNCKIINTSLNDTCIIIFILTPRGGSPTNIIKKK